MARIMYIGSNSLQVVTDTQKKDKKEKKKGSSNVSTQVAKNWTECYQKNCIDCSVHSINIYIYAYIMCMGSDWYNNGLLC